MFGGDEGILPLKINFIIFKKITELSGLFKN
jgi:hypothetical protein